MNREAAALGVPVYSIFRGKIGAVDRYLADQGRMTLIESVEDVRAKIKLVPWARPEAPNDRPFAALEFIVQSVVNALAVSHGAQ